MNKRVEEVANSLREIVTGRGNMKFDEYLSNLPEFQEQKSPWVQCSERMPPLHEFVVVETDGRALVLASFNGTPNPRWIAWCPIPPYVRPESELVRRWKEEFSNHDFRGGFPLLSRDECLAMIRKVEEEMGTSKSRPVEPSQNRT